MMRPRKATKAVSFSFLRKKEFTMALPAKPGSETVFTPHGAVKVSASAIILAREFNKTLKGTRGGDWVIAFDWAGSVNVRKGPRQSSEAIGSCLMLGAFKRSEIPRGFTQTVDDVEFAIRIPNDILERSKERLVDIDKALLFKLALL